MNGRIFLRRKKFNKIEEKPAKKTGNKYTRIREQVRGGTTRDAQNY